MHIFLRTLPHLLEEDHATVLLDGRHAPEQEGDLGEAEARGPAQHPVPGHLEGQEDGDQDPVLEPPLVILHLLAEHGLDMMFIIMMIQMTMIMMMMALTLMLL